MARTERTGRRVFAQPALFHRLPTWLRRGAVHAAHLACALQLLAGLSGCDKALSTVNEVQQAVTNRVEEVKQVAATAGQIQLQVDNKPIQTTGCYGVVCRLDTPRQSVFQVTSYNDPSAESFPSFFARAFVSDAGDIAPGKQLEVQVYLQENPNSTVWESLPNEPAELKITSVANGVFEAEIAGMVVNSDDGLHKTINGALSGSLAQGPAK